MAVAWVQNICDQAPATNGIATAFTFTFTGAAFTSGHGAGGACQIAAGAPALSTVADNQGNNWTILDTGGINTSFGIARIPGTAPTSVTLTFASAPANGNNVFTVIDEISGAVAINAHHGTQSASGGTSYSDNSTTNLTTMLLGLTDLFTTGVVTAGTGTLRDNQLPNSGFSSSSQTNVGPGPQTVTFNCSIADPFTCTVFTIAFTGDTLGGIVSGQYPAQFPMRQKYLPLRLIDDVFIPQAAVPPVTQMGFLPPDPMPVRQRFRPLLSADEQWPFTAVSTPTQVGWEWRPEFARARFRPMRFADEEWPFTATNTPGQFGWDNPERFPLRIRFRPSKSADEEWPFTAVPTPTQFSFDWPPQFPVRGRFRTFQSSDEQWPFTTTVRPAQIDYFPQFPTRIRFRPLIYEPFNPAIPPAVPQFQVMSGTATKVKATSGATYITAVLQGTGAFVFNQTQSPTIFNEVLPFGSAHVVLTSGSTPTSVALGVSNNGVNFVQMGPSLTTFPNILNLTATGSPTLLYGARPTKYHAWIVVGGDATTVLTITELFVGWRG